MEVKKTLEGMTNLEEISDEVIGFLRVWSWDFIKRRHLTNCENHTHISNVEATQNNKR